MRSANTILHDDTRKVSSTNDDGLTQAWREKRPEKVANVHYHQQLHRVDATQEFLHETILKCFLVLTTDLTCPDF